MKNFFLKKNKIFTIAEFGSNHSGNINDAKKAINLAKYCKADAIKFQSISLQDVYKKVPINLKRIQNKININENWYPKLFKHAKKKQITLSFSAIYPKIVDILEDNKIKFFKIASPQVFGFPEIIELVARTKKPVLLSSGYCDTSQIDRAIKILKKNKNYNYAILHCISEYPTQTKNLNLNFIKELKKRYKCPVGFSDHTIGTHVSCAAVALGADIIEKHVRLDTTSKKSPDYDVSITFERLREMINQINMIKKGLGVNKKILSSFEKKTRDKLLVFPHFKKNYSKKNLIGIDDINFFRLLKKKN